ncbi:glutathione S-transferase family protein [Roseomonas nepalensis]|uniref:Glutathione S-transferase family protein n=1 Tax=Muricoccus nepalensis TaxID=1854500 RepID=A0A502G9Q4_9PROT|nr:glutathione S-transferase family protein [Roseomonas nepalensis]TPG58658.1 glutathione S-transferase family protein [Roseomonas nepalensis]
MRILHHLPLSPACRKVRLALHEKRIPFELRAERIWERREEFLAMNPAGTVPVLEEETGLVIADSSAICEYLDEAYPDMPLIGRTHAERAEVRRLVAWFDGKFDREVTRNLYFEKQLKRMLGRGNPDAGALRAGYANIKPHIEYIGWLAESRAWLAGGQISLADLAAAAHLSCLDYIGDVDWSMNDAVKDWYARVKSRPAFRPILADRVSGLTPPNHYADLDF